MWDVALVHFDLGGYWAQGDLPTVQLVGGFEAQVDEVLWDIVTAGWPGIKAEQEQHKINVCCKAPCTFLHIIHMVHPSCDPHQEACGVLEEDHQLPSEHLRSPCSFCLSMRRLHIRSVCVSSLCLSCKTSCQHSQSGWVTAQMWQLHCGASLHVCNKLHRQEQGFDLYLVQGVWFIWSLVAKWVLEKLFPLVFSWAGLQLLCK